MSSYIFETVEFKNQYPVNAFVASIQSSSFHWHYEYELIVVLKGRITISVSPKPITLCQGDIILVNTKIVHEIKSEDENICMILQLDPALFKKENDDNICYRFYLNSVVDEEPAKKEYSYFIKKVAGIVLPTLQQDKKSCYRLRAEIYDLIADLFEYVQYDMYMKSEQSDSNAAMLMKIIDYLKDNLSKEDVVNCLYKEIGMGEKTVYRYLKEHVGISLKEMLDTLRASEAKRLLKNTDKSIACIIDECGFGSENTFYRLFKKNTGLRPNEYRQQKIDIEKTPKLRGYLDFEQNEARRILLEILEDKK
jgi:AraC-type DNA-binding domain-containing proteins